MVSGSGIAYFSRHDTTRCRWGGGRAGRHGRVTGSHLLSLAVSFGFYYLGFYWSAAGMGSVGWQMTAVHHDGRAEAEAELAEPRRHVQRNRLPKAFHSVSVAVSFTASTSWTTSSPHPSPQPLSLSSHPHLPPSTRAAKASPSVTWESPS